MTQSPEDPLRPVKGAWWPFEYGPRACFRIELPILEMKILMILALRVFDLSIAYDDDLQDRCIKVVAGERDCHPGRGQPVGNLSCRGQRRSVQNSRSLQIAMRERSSKMLQS